jgi:hypothetical protein
MVQPHTLQIAVCVSGDTLFVHMHRTEAKRRHDQALEDGKEKEVRRDTVRSRTASS